MAAVGRVTITAPVTTAPAPGRFDLPAFAAVVAWPLVVLTLLLLYRRPLMGLMRRLSTGVKSVSVGGFSVGLFEAKPLPPPSEQAAVDLKHTGAPTDINDSSLRTFYEQVEDRPMASGAGRV